MYLFDVASRHMTWLAEGQQTTAVNIANADTPGYRVRSVGPFSSFLEAPATELAVTSPLHINTPSQQAASSSNETGNSWGSAHSGNNVSLEQELMTASRNNRMMNIDAGLVRSFHRMLLSSVKV